MSGASNVHLDTGGMVKLTPQLVKAQGQSRDNFIRTCVGGIVVVLLTVAYLIALYNKLEGASSLLVLLGSIGTGYLSAHVGRER